MKKGFIANGEVARTLQSYCTFFSLELEKEFVRYVEEHNLFEMCVFSYLDDKSSEDWIFILTKDIRGPNKSLCKNP